MVHGVTKGWTRLKCLSKADWHKWDLPRELRARWGESLCPLAIFSIPWLQPGGWQKASWRRRA